MLKYKLFKWFAGLVLVFGALSAALGIWLITVEHNVARDEVLRRVVQEAQTRVRYDLSSAWSVYQSQLRAMETVVRLTAAREPLVAACSSQKWGDQGDPRTGQELQGILGKACLDHDLDFFAIAAPDGRVVARAKPPFSTGDYRNAEPLIAKALAGEVVSGTVVLSREELDREAGGLADRAFLSLQETPHARPTPRTSEDRGCCMLAAAPVVANGRVIGVIYAGSLLNRNEAFVDRIQNIVFGQDKYQGLAVGTVTVFLADTRIATTVRLVNGNRAIGTRVSAEVADRVLDNGASWDDRAFVVQDWYLTVYDPIRDSRGAVVGMLYVGALERPFSDLRQAMIVRYNDLRESVIVRYSLLVACALVGALLMAMFIAGRVAFPLHRLADGADRMRHGEPFKPVSPNRSCVETAGLIQAFNEMAATLTQREEQLKDANDQLGKTNQSLETRNAQYMETLQFVSHELNSPLSSITNYAYMLRQQLLGGLTEKQAAALDVMTVNLKRVMEMTRHYLNLARIEKGEIQPVPTRVAVREDVIAPILASLQTDINAASLRVEDLIGPRVILQSDLNMTREVFENLLGNAVKYGRPGGLITLNCRTDGPWAEFSVRNEGEGIPPERRGELFQKFSRIELGESKKARRGTGLGLFITRKIVEAHGGTIVVDSEVGKWTEFRCTLPLARDGPPPAEPKGAPAAAASIAT